MCERIHFTMDCLCPFSGIRSLKCLVKAGQCSGGIVTGVCGCSKYNCILHSGIRESNLPHQHCQRGLQCLFQLSIHNLPLDPSRYGLPTVITKWMMFEVVEPVLHLIETTSPNRGQCRRMWWRNWQAKQQRSSNTPSH